MKVILPLSAILLLTACGGGGSGGRGLEDDGLASGGACDNAYYRELIGTYRGDVIYDVSQVVPTSVIRCDWTMMARVEIESETNRCSLRMVIDSDVRQDVVLAGDDPDAYQCAEENSIRSIRDPNQSTDPSTFDDVVFPVLADLEGAPSVPSTGPYFGDETFEVIQIYLFDGPGRLADFVQFEGDGNIRLLSSQESANEALNGLLVKD